MRNARSVDAVFTCGGTVLDEIEAYLAFLSDERRLSANTLVAYRNDLSQFGQFLRSERGSRQVLTPGRASEATLARPASREEVADFFLDLRERGYAMATIARKMAAVKSLFNYLCRNGTLSVSPAADLGSPIVKKPLPRAISLSQIAALVAQAERRATPEAQRDAVMLRVLCATGMRISELVMLDVADVDLIEGVARCVGRNDRMRSLPLDATVVAELRSYLEEGRVRLLHHENSSQALFLNHRGRRLTRQGFWLIMKTLARDAGITAEITPHTLRHSFAAHRLKAGLALNRLRDLLGHANISTTQIYTQVRLEQELPTTAPLLDPVGARS